MSITPLKLILPLVFIGSLAGMAAAQQAQPSVDPVTRLSVTGAIKCASRWETEPKQYEIFELSRRTLALIGRVAREGRSGDLTEAEKAEYDDIDKQEKAMKLNSFIMDSIDRCMNQEIERVISLVGKLPNP